MSMTLTPPAAAGSAKPAESLATESTTDGMVDVIESRYRGGRLVSRRRVQTHGTFAAAAEAIAHLQRFRSVQAWDDRVYTAELRKV